MFYRKAKRAVRVCGFWEKEPEERKEEQPERVEKQRASRQALWARRGLPQNTTRRFPFAFRGVCVCVCAHAHVCLHTHTHAHIAQSLRKVLGRSGEGCPMGWDCPHL